MHVRTIRTAAPALTAAVVAASLIASASPADARSRSSYSSSGRAAQASWIQLDSVENDGTPGNAHVGDLYARETGRGSAEVWGTIFDYDCPEGVEPGGGHGPHGTAEEPSPEPACQFIGARDIYGQGLSFSLDNKLTTARLTGNVTVADHGTVAGRPPVDMTWVGVGSLSESSWTSTYSSGGYSYTDRYSSTSRQATVSGRLATMGFDPERSSAYMESYRMTSRSRSR